jgi:glycosyltransferase involved in cell wall biosynthesis
VDSPKVSIIIPVFNGENFIEHSLNSIASQTYQSFEVLIINDGSTDNSLPIIQKWMSENAGVVNVKVFSTANSGVSSARNTGIQESIGEYIAFLDCDDYWEAGKLETQVRILQEDHECVGVITNFFLIKDVSSGELKSYGLINHKSIESLRIGWCSLLGNGGLISSSLIYRKNLDLKFSTQLSTSADLDFFLNLSLDGKVLIVGEPLVNYRIHGSQMHLSSLKLIHDYEILAGRLSIYKVLISKKVLTGNVLAMSALLEFSSGNFLKGFSLVKKSFKANYGSMFSILISVLWKRARSKLNFIFWSFKNSLGKLQ